MISEKYSRRLATASQLHRIDDDEQEEEEQEQLEANRSLDEDEVMNDVFVSPEEAAASAIVIDSSKGSKSSSSSTTSSLSTLSPVSSLPTTPI